MQHPFAAPPAPGDTLDVAPGVRWLRMPLPFALDHINLWLVAAALHSSARRVLISGDMLLPRISTNVSFWPAEPEGDPLARFLDSLRAKRSRT